MPKITLSNIGQVVSSQGLLNNNFGEIEEAVENTLSRDGSSPNEMNTDLDMNNHRIYNLAAAESSADAVRLSDLSDFFSATSSTSNSIALGLKTFTVEENRFFEEGDWILAVNELNSDNYLHGSVSSYDEDTGILEMQVTNIGGSGTHTSWIIRFSGTQGAVGARGVPGGLPEIEEGAPSDLQTGDKVVVVRGGELVSIVPFETEGGGTGSLEILADIIDASDLSRPEDILFSDDGNYAFIPCRDGASLTVIDISDPLSPFILSAFRDADLSQGMGVAKNGTTLYLTSWLNCRLLILDASDPANIVKLSSIQIGDIYVGPLDSDGLRKVVYDGGYCYLTQWPDGNLVIADVSNPLSPSVVGSVAIGYSIFAVEVHGDYAYTAEFAPVFSSGEIKIVDISNKAAPVVVKTIIDGKYYGACSFKWVDDLIYVVNYYQYTLAVIDVSDPPNAVELGFLNAGPLNFPNRLFIEDDIVYIASAEGWGVAKVNISSPSVPAFISSVGDPKLKKCYSVAVKDEYLYAVGREANSFCVMRP